MDIENAQESRKRRQAAEAPPTAPASPSQEEKEDNDDESEYPLVDYFKDPSPKPRRHQWLVNFYRQLFTLSAGFHKEKNRLQHACQVKRLKEETNPSRDDITFMAEDEGNTVWLDWVVPNLKKKKPGTLKSYLTSLKLFLEYVSKKGKRL